jgi:hypothetical protein
LVVKIGRWLSSMAWLCLLAFSLLRLKNRFKASHNLSV